MKTKLFSKISLLVSLKGLGSSLLTAVPLWILSLIFMGKGMISLAILFAVLSFVSFFFLWGWTANKLWGWK